MYCTAIGSFGFYARWERGLGRVAGRNPVKSSARCAGVQLLADVWRHKERNDFNESVVLQVATTVHGPRDCPRTEEGWCRLRENTSRSFLVAEVINYLLLSFITTYLFKGFYCPFPPLLVRQVPEGILLLFQISKKLRQAKWGTYRFLPRHEIHLYSQ